MGNALIIDECFFQFFGFYFQFVYLFKQYIQNPSTSVLDCGEKFFLVENDIPFGLFERKEANENFRKTSIKGRQAGVRYSHGRFRCFERHTLCEAKTSFNINTPNAKRTAKIVMKID